MRNLFRYTVPVLIIMLGGMFVMRLLFGRAPVPDAFLGALAFNEALERSAETDKPVLVLATADWCVPCQQLKRTALRDARVSEVIREQTIPVYLDVTRNKGDVYVIAERLGVEQIPAMILLREGVETSRIEGERSALELLSWLGIAEQSRTN